MAFSLHNFQISDHGAVVKGSGYLTDTAAVCHNRFAVNVCGTGLIALFGSTLTNNAVVAEHIARVQNVAIDGCGGQLNVGITVALTASLGGIGRKLITEQQAIEILGRLFGLCPGEGNLNDIAGLSLTDCGIDSLIVKSIAIGTAQNFKGFFLKFTLNRLRAILGTQSC